MNRSMHSLSSGDFADVSSASRSSSAGLRRSIARSRSSGQQNVEQRVGTAAVTGGELQRSSALPVTTSVEGSRASSGAGVVVSSTTPELDQQSAMGQQRRPSNNSFMMRLSSHSDSAGRDDDFITLLLYI